MGRKSDHPDQSDSSRPRLLHDPSSGHTHSDKSVSMTTELHITECMTFPRSGHSLLGRLLADYFGDQRFHYCEMYTEMEKRIGVDGTTNFQKNHDLDLETTIHPDRHYLVQIRYPIESLVSWFKLKQARGEIDNSADQWVNFALQNASFWSRFYRKWVLDPMPRRLILNYTDLIDAPVETLQNVVRFLGDDECDVARIEACCANQRIERKSDYHAFKFYGREFFTLLKGLFAAVPGVDIENDLLVVPSALVNPDESQAALRATVCKLKDMGNDLKRLTSRLSDEIDAQPPGQSVDGRQLACNIATAE